MPYFTICCVCYAPLLKILMWTFLITWDRPAEKPFGTVDTHRIGESGVSMEMHLLKCLVIGGPVKYYINYFENPNHLASLLSPRHLDTSLLNLPGLLGNRQSASRSQSGHGTRIEAHGQQAAMDSCSWTVCMALVPSPMSVKLTSFHWPPLFETCKSFWMFISPNTRPPKYPHAGYLAPIVVSFIHRSMSLLRPGFWLMQFFYSERILKLRNKKPGFNNSM